MTAQHLAETELVDGIPALQLLEGLARIYQLVLVTDRDGRLLWISNRLEEICGAAELHLGRDVRRIVPQLPRPEQIFSMRRQLRSEGHIAHVRVDMEVPGAGPRAVEASLFGVSTLRGNEELVVAIVRPLDEEARPAGAGADGSALATILASAPDPIVAVDERGFVTYANPAVGQLIRQPADSLVGRPIAVLTGKPMELDRLISSLGAGQGVDFQDLELLRRDGTTVHVSVAASALRDAEGEVRGTVLSLRDVTERRIAERELRSANRELEHCVQTLAHDLRSPLVALLGFSRLLRQDYGARLDDTGAHFLERIEQSGRTMENLIHDLLELSRIGQPGERRTLVDPRSVLLQLQAELKPRLEDSQIRLHLPTNPPLVYCDRTRLYQVFSNLIENALQHMGPCEEPVVSVEVADAGDSHRISVRDRGRGIPAEHHQEIFEVLQRIGTREDGRRGAGIGLAIVKKIAETHGGRVWVESECGKGAAFHLTLPKA